MKLNLLNAKNWLRAAGKALRPGKPADARLAELEEMSPEFRRQIEQGTYTSMGPEVWVDSVANEVKGPGRGR